MTKNGKIYTIIDYNQIQYILMTILSKIHVDYKHMFKGNPGLPSSGQD